MVLVGSGRSGAAALLCLQHDRSGAREGLTAQYDITAVPGLDETSMLFETVPPNVRTKTKIATRLQVA